MTFGLGLGSVTVSVAAVGVPPTALRRECFRPEAESGGRDARAPQKSHHPNWNRGAENYLRPNF